MIELDGLDIRQHDQPIGAQEPRGEFGGSVLVDHGLDAAKATAWGFDDEYAAACANDGHP